MLDSVNAIEKVDDVGVTDHLTTCEFVVVVGTSPWLSCVESDD